MKNQKNNIMNLNFVKDDEIHSTSEQVKIANEKISENKDTIGKRVDARKEKRVKVETEEVKKEVVKPVGEVKPTLDGKPMQSKEAKKTIEEKRSAAYSNKETIEQKRAREEASGKARKRNEQPPLRKKPENTPRWKAIIKDYRTYIMFVYFVALIALLGQVVFFDVVPLKYFIPSIVVVTILTLLICWLQYSKKVNKINRVLGSIMAVVMAGLMIFGNLSIYQANSAIEEMSVQAGDTEYEIMSVVVNKDNEAEKLEDVKDDVFAIPETIDEEHTLATIEDINEQLNKTIKTASYANTNEQAGALLDEEVDAMILNEAYRSLLDENYPTFETDTKVIYTFKIAKEVKELGSKVDVLTEPYHVYISGIDTYGPIAAKSRSDVNMIATINPKTKQIILTSIPRDFYVAQTCQGNQKDKLTHTGIFGVDCTVESMQNFTNLTFNYYVRVNFSSMEKIVNAIGGIDIYNQISFYSGVDGTFIQGGDIHLNGNTALKFARERYAYADGDRQRGRNQMIVLEGIIAKATSPAIITGYSGIMEAIGENFQTNMNKDEMTSIIKDQLDSGASWNIVQQSVTGAGGTDWTPANGFNAYVMYPDQTSVDTALANIKTVVDGGTVEIE